MRKQVLGAFRAIGSLIEYQNQGNIHCYIVLWTANRRELSYPEYIDSVVSAKAPDCGQEPELYGLLSKYMMHGPCDSNGNNSCIRRKEG